ncbi:hypothetical protein LVJ94_35135 [Pendulispora rubella]|uniref:HEAT repeat domain-containing protein n=1 Tax=Pendulispora rubella TaxID=2741070 RepID=A0ABZ2KTY6_9BACT
MKRIVDVDDYSSWSALEHAFGPARDVPDLLVDTRSSSQETRGTAWAMLRERLFVSDGREAFPRRFSASPAVIPFLAGHACDRTAPDRHEALLLMLRLAVGDPDQNLGSDWTMVQIREGCDALVKSAPEDAEQANLWCACYEAARQEIPQLARLVAARTRKLRLAAVTVCPFFVDYRTDLSAALLRRWDRTDLHPRERAAVIIALSVLAPLPDEALAELADDLSANALVRAASAVSLHRRGQKLSGRALSVLREAAKRAVAGGEFPWERYVRRLAKEASITAG